MNKKIVQKIKYKSQRKEKIRLDLFAMDTFGITRNQAQKMVLEGLILVNDEIKKPKYTMNDGDQITLLKPEKNETEIEIPVIFEDEDILVIDKPSGITTHPAPGEKELTVYEYFKDKLLFGSETDREGIVHRLDKGTSGVMILAKNASAQKVLQKDFRDRKIHKTYLALISGQMEQKSGTIDIPIERDKFQKERMTVSKEGKEAVTEFKSIKTYEKYSLLSLNPKTGRTHQIRVHLSALGHPVVGDLRYGKPTPLVNRIFLHAKEIEFRHPKTKRKMAFESPLPSELEEILTRLY